MNELEIAKVLVGPVGVGLAAVYAVRWLASRLERSHDRTIQLLSDVVSKNTAALNQISHVLNGCQLRSGLNERERIMD